MLASPRIDLAHEAGLLVGRLSIDPARRELLRDDGAREVIEHRVMQVLVALARADGAIVTRDELVRTCWDGRIVGDDAINRVIGRLRKAADGIGAGSFRIETVTRIGYRLAAGDDMTVRGGHAPATRRHTLTLLAAGGVAALAAGGTFVYRRSLAPEVSPAVEAMEAQAWNAWTQGDRDAVSQAIGLYRRMTELAPDYPDGWGLLACIYADTAHGSPLAEADTLRLRARAAATRALGIDARNAYARAAMACARPIRGNWLVMERGFRQALADQPAKHRVMWGLGLSYLRVGRTGECAEQFARLSSYSVAPGQYWCHINALWGGGRLDEAERLAEEANRVFPKNPSVWFARLFMAMYSGRGDLAIALAGDVDGRPGDFEPAVYDNLIAVAQAIDRRDPAAAEAVMTAQLANARIGATQARNAIQVASALGNLDEAFAVADAYYFSRGFVVPDDPAAPARQPNLASRDTWFLFMPSTEAMRADARFGRLTTELGLERYWRDAGAQPDYRRA